MKANPNPQAKSTFLNNPYLWSAFIAVAIALVRVLGNPIQLHLPFISDDLRYFYFAITTPDCYIFTACIQYFFRPVVHLLYLLLLHTVGTNFLGVHLAFIVMHCGLAIMVAVFFRRLTGAPLALVAPLVILWGVFGGYDEVFYFTSSFATELMGAWFIILALWFFLRHLDGDGPFWIVPICIVLAYGSKESSIVVLPLMALLCAWRRKLPQRWILKLVIVAIPTVGYLALEYFLQVVVAGSLHKPNTKMFFVGWHVLGNYYDVLEIISGGGIWLGLAEVWRSIVGVILLGAALWLGRRDGLLAFAMLLVMILPFSLKTTSLIEFDTRHLYMPAMFWSLLLLIACNHLANSWGKQVAVAAVLWLSVTVSAVSGILWINARYEHYLPEIRYIEITLRQVYPELKRDQKMIPLRGYELIDPIMLPVLNEVYFDGRLQDLSAMTPEEAAAETLVLGYDPPRALGWERMEENPLLGRNIWRTLPDGNIYNGK
jgi:hypothetical protein